MAQASTTGNEAQDLGFCSDEPRGDTEGWGEEHFALCWQWQNKQEIKADSCIKNLRGERKFPTDLLVLYGFGITVHLPVYLEKVSPLLKVPLLVL